ncbi:Putative ribonuclease Z/Hydroxyacylglutathione hydrolase [Septoria linicola]|uniref:Ribonuclease Z/Hydroxyacylglutathione hydrolase n=1 Tax=Septoria linicola TaxID=215465 RepID=A0A9Q9EQ13_9PEZI|nr:Putative ribonuclease Z/Hydroxyacylglutathione hydrolase [Septoria linicola]
MSLTVQQLNADSSFLLTFKPSFAPRNVKGKFPGSFSILIDPWLDGASSVFHPKFATTYHTSPSSVRSLQELKDEVDVIVISQDKPDHCHQETLCSLSKNSKTKIFATPKAAFKIREWKHFNDPSIIEEIPTYSTSKGEAAFLRIPIEPYSSSSAAGEITITNVTTKADLTRLHNGIGITYRPPGTILTTIDGDLIKLGDLPMSARPGTQNPPFKTIRKMPSISSPIGIIKGIRPRSPTSPSSPQSKPDSFDSRHRPRTSFDRKPDAFGSSTPRSNYESVMSVLYTPHGIEPSNLRPYIDNHLAALPGALPITALFHALNMEANPKLLGGLISTGAPGGVEIVKEVDVKYWISAHDEIKQNEGWATKFMSSRVYDVEEAIKLLRVTGGIGSDKGKRTVVESLGNGGVRTYRGG